MASKRRNRKIMRRKSVKGGVFFTNNKVNPITTDPTPNTTFRDYLSTELYKTNPCFTTEVTPNNKFCVKNVNNNNGIHEINGIYENASSDSTIQITPNQLDTKITIYQKGGKSTKKRRTRVKQRF